MNAAEKVNSGKNMGIMQRYIASSSLNTKNSVLCIERTGCYKKGKGKGEEWRVKGALLRLYRPGSVFQSKE